VKQDVLTRGGTDLKAYNTSTAKHTVGSKNSETTNKMGMFIALKLNVYLKL